MEGALRKLLKVAILGAPNSGKSTLLNRLVRNEVSCVSNKVHTTRRNVLGVYTEDDTQIEFYDSPGLVVKKQSLRHRLEPRMLIEPEEAALKCDLMAVVVDASNIREQRRLNKGAISLLNQNSDKRSILILNKVDLVRQKRSLLDFSHRLTKGCIEGRPTSQCREQLTSDLLSPVNKSTSIDSNPKVGQRILHKHVIDLNQDTYPQLLEETIEAHIKPQEEEEEIGYDKFSQVFSISALHDDGVDELRTHMMSLALPVPKWPHGFDYLTNQESKDIAHNIIRGRVMDLTSSAIPYNLTYKFLCFQYDDCNSLSINVMIRCPESYMISAVVGAKGANISRICDESREAIAKALGCEVKLNAVVKSVEKIN